MSKLPDEFCKEILRLDPSIRYAAILDRSDNKIMEAMRDDISPLLPPDVARISLMHAAERMRERILLRPYIGRPIYFVGIYEKIKRLTIPLQGKYYLLAISMDVNADHDKIVREKIMPFLAEHQAIEPDLSW